MSLWIEEDRLPRGGKTGLSTEKKYLIGQGAPGCEFMLGRNVPHAPASLPPGKGHIF